MSVEITDPAVTLPAMLVAGEAAYIVRPGDSVILNYPAAQISQQTAAVIKATAASLLPEGVSILIVSGATVTIARGNTEGEPA